MALTTQDERVRQVHDDMARRYEDLARAIISFERHAERELEATARD
jgi:ubiquinone/menaquinone biosynthesis C-methylase UbiE